MPHYNNLVENSLGNIVEKEEMLVILSLGFTCLQYKCSENTVGKGETAYNTQFLLYLQCFLPVQRPFYHFHPI